MQDVYVLNIKYIIVPEHDPSLHDFGLFLSFGKVMLVALISSILFLVTHRIQRVPSVPQCCFPTSSLGNHLSAAVSVQTIGNLEHLETKPLMVLMYFLSFENIQMVLNPNSQTFVQS